MVVLRDGRARAVRGGDGLQCLSRNRAAGKSQPISLCHQTNALDVDWFCSNVRGDALRLSTIEPSLDRLRIADLYSSAAGRGLWFLAG